ncbi:MAG: hypothetical protein V4693_21605 [Pseudomonadota bacterium]
MSDLTPAFGTQAAATGSPAMALSSCSRLAGLVRCRSALAPDRLLRVLGNQQLPAGWAVRALGDAGKLVTLTC